MSSHPIAILNTGLVTSIGLTAAATCAAIRAKVTNPTESRFMDSDGEWILAHQIPLDEAWRGRPKLAKMAAASILECLAVVPRAEWPTIPLLLCVAEHARPGRVDGLDEDLFSEIQAAVGTEFSSDSRVFPHGRVAAGAALGHARSLLEGGQAQHVLVAATDSLLTWPTLSAFDHEGRLLTPENSNGFMPGEAGGALLVGTAASESRLICIGVGFSAEQATIESEEPLRGDGLTQAVRNALADAQCELHDLDFRITDLAGEQYYFKEAALALGRVLRQRKERFEMWHPAEFTGETGAVSGIVCLAVALAACRKGYAPGRGCLVHAGVDAGDRVAIVLTLR
jgi:3-oxoacyl-[acyl-carrier-protein] synthase-1